MSGKRYKKKAKKGYRKRYQKKGYAMSKIPRGINKMVGQYRFKRYGYKADIAGTGVTQYAAYTFFLSEVIAYNEFTNLFDQYMIENVKVRFRLLLDPAAQTATNAIFPILYYRKDYDDDAVPASVDELRQCQDTGMVFVHPNKLTTISLKPKSLRAMYNPSVNAYSSIPRAWIDCSYANAPHYGLKFAVQRLPTGCTLLIDTLYTVRFKSPR